MTAQIYVGTYGKYSGGSIAGAWLSLKEHDTESAFYAAAKELHKNEHDPELMFQDCEGFPRELYGESHLDDRIWEWLGLDKDTREIVSAWLDANGGTDSLDYIVESYAGHWDSWDAYVYQYVGDMGLLANAPEEIANYFDYESFGRVLSYDYTVANADSGGVHLFRNQ
jgi:antirestriction protein